MLFSLLLPAVLLVMFNSVFAAGNGTVDLSGERVAAHSYFTGQDAHLRGAAVGLQPAGHRLVNQRETGQLKLMAVVLILIARVGYGVRLSVNGLADVVLFAVLGTAAIAGVAMATTVLVTDVDSAGAVLP